jgi:hypothetical protein
MGFNELQKIEFTATFLKEGESNRLGVDRAGCSRADSVM